MSNKLPKWDEERTNNLMAIAGDPETAGTITNDIVAEAAEALETTTRSISSKLRKMGYDVESSVKATKKSFTEEEEEALREFVESNPNVYTFAEIALSVFGDVERARNVQGKLLSMELTSLVKKAEPKESVKTYTDDEEDMIVDLVNKGAFIEEIAQKLDRDIKSIRGKCLSMLRSHGIEMPKQDKSNAKTPVDSLEALGEAISDLSVDEIAEKIGKTVRGIKVMLTHRGLTAKDYDGAAKKAKNLAKKKSET